ncbi:RimK family alpha-L-glutamate ligase [Melioribacteraceae bacterium 4301-Me]|uniref:ATP-grasp domain-containing protein n=1 Tax=Pyranulibacter aquaticus TaxID=3163344 RepID=UPI003594E61B
MENLKELGFVSDDEIVYPYFEELGWKVEPVAWQKPNADWNKYDVVLIRTTWDYQNHPGKFLSVLERITKSTHLENPLEVVRWNLNKNYLLKLQRKGIDIPPTIKFHLLDYEKVINLFDKLQSDEIIIKPIISANADRTYKLHRDTFQNTITEVLDTINKQEYLAQPFRKNVVEEGEYSVFFFNNKFSHAILKTPKAGDFRVQEEHGGVVRSVSPFSSLIETAEKILKVLKRKLLYARVDLIRNEQNKFELIELELIEPSLYLRTNPEAPVNFAKAFNEWFK